MIQEQLATLKTTLMTHAETSKIQLQAIFDNTNLAIFTVNKNACFDTFNPVFVRKCLEIFHKQVILGESLWNFFPDIMHAPFQEALQKTTQGINSTFEIELPAIYTRKHWVEIWANPLKKEDQVIGTLFIVKDITRQKQTETQRRETEFLLQSISNNIRDGIFRSTPEKGIIYVNRAFADIFGYTTAQEAIDTPPSAYYASVADRRYLAELLVRQGYYKNEEILFKRKDGSTFWGVITVTLYQSMEGEVFYDGVVSDITEKKLQAQQIRENEQTLRSINQNIKDALYRIHEKRGLIYANTAFRELFDYPIEIPLQEIVHTNCFENPLIYRKLRKKLATQQSCQNEEIKFRRRDGSVFWGLINVSVSEDENGSKVYDGAITDITERKIFEEKLQASQESLQKQNEELERINYELDNFVYITSHDLKAPLASILGLVNVMRLEESVASADNIYLNLIEQSIHKLNNFISDIIDYSKNSRLRITSQQIDFPDLVTQVWEDLLLFDIDSESFPTVRIEGKALFFSDRKRLMVILKNLLSNAVRYHDKTKTHLHIDIFCEITEKEAFIRLKDNGEGIAAEHIAKIFDMFYRASPRSKGAGLGLYIVRQIVQTLGGRISVHSTLGAGTEFYIHLPNLRPKL